MIDEILKFNKRFVAEKGYEKYITTKYPDKKIAIVTCMDTRLVELLPAALGLRNGDVKIIKNAGGVITNAETREKTALFDEALFPVLAVVDPELTKTVPAKFTAFQGFDALFHSTEACISRRANLMSDMYALAAIENVARFLPRAVRDGNDIEARTRVSWGNTLSGSVMCVGSCTSEHSLEHAMSAFHQELPHGAGLIMISKAYYAHFVRRGVCPERFVRMAKAMGAEDASVPEDFLRALEKLQNDCGVGDLKMSDYGIVPEEFPEMARNAKEAMGFLFPNDPAPLSDEDCVEIYRNSYK